MSELGFSELKLSLDVPDEYTFRIVSVIAVEDLTDPVGSAAFMLRRMQAIRYLAGTPLNVERHQLLLSYVTDLAYYLDQLLDRGIVERSAVLAGLLSLTMQLTGELSETLP